MSNKRAAKKDVNFLTNEVLVDGIMLMSLYEKKESDTIMSHLEKVAVARNQLVDVLQHRDKKFDRLPKAERKNERSIRSKAFRATINDKFKAFDKAFDEAYECFGNLAKEK